MPELPHKLKTSQFSEFFAALHGGRQPFVWQKMLMEQVAREGQWPDLLDLPTASGKTACIDIAIFALAMGLKTPRRIWFVVDRRIVVDEAYGRAQMIADRIRSGVTGILKQVQENLHALASVERNHDKIAPIGVARLRGGMSKNTAWSRNPLQPAVITSTIDQLGSRLLFRGYGVSDRQKPIHAALAGNDSLIILDEAHLAAPFAQTVHAIARFREKPWANEPLDLPFHLMIMSATPPEGVTGGREPITFPTKGERKIILADPPLQDRLTASKPAQLVIAAKPKMKGKEAIDVCEDEFVAEAAFRAAQYAKAGKKCIAIMVNRVATAQAIVNELQKHLAVEQHPHIHLLTGRMRPVDRDAFIEDYADWLKSGSTKTPEQPLFIVTTQCLEVGADFSFDALVTECASLDALRQRFGRLNRLGTFPGDSLAAILIRKKDAKPLDALKDDAPADPIYGNALARTWHWLNGIGTTVDMGIVALQSHLDELGKEGLPSLCVEKLQAPTMFPQYLDTFSQTNPRPVNDPEVSWFLHGVPRPDSRQRLEVKVLWRNSLNQQILAITPPLSMEMLTVPLQEFAAAVQHGRYSPGDDLEGTQEDDDRNSSKATGDEKQLTIYRDGEFQTIGLSKILNQDVVVLPADDEDVFKRLCYGNVQLRADVYEWAYFRTKETVAIRFPLAFPSLREKLSQEIVDEMPDAEKLLATAKEAFNGAREKRELTLSNCLKERTPKDFRIAIAADTSKQTVDYVLIEKSKQQPMEDWGFDTDDEEEGRSSYVTGHDATLKGHTEAVARAGEQLKSLVPRVLHQAIMTAIRLHDVGKADPRFQSYLLGRRSAAGSELLAKSNRDPGGMKDRKIRNFFEVPKGFRHESVSLQWAAAFLSESESNRDLVLHLIGTHHGFGRPFLPAVTDDAAPAMEIDGACLTHEQRAKAKPCEVASGVVDRFWNLTRALGWWHLAYLETLVRAADQYASAKGDNK